MAIKNLCLSSILLFVFSVSEVKCQEVESNDSTKFSNQYQIETFGSVLLRYFSQVSFGVVIEKPKLSHSVYVKSGAFLGNFYYSLYTQTAYKLKSIDFKNQTQLNFEIPVWFAYRNFRSLAWGEERGVSDFVTFFHAGSGIDVRYDVSKRISIVTKVGMGVGPKYVNAGDFRYNEFEYDGIKTFPNLDCSIMLWFNR
jgi:hypothetical protein